MVTIVLKAILMFHFIRGFDTIKIGFLLCIYQGSQGTCSSSDPSFRKGDEAYEFVRDLYDSSYSCSTCCKADRL